MAIRWLTEQAGGQFSLQYLPIDHDEQWARVQHRQATAPHTTFVMTQDDLHGWRAGFQAPTVDEVEAPTPDPESAGFADWHAWAADRWPSFS